MEKTKIVETRWDNCDHINGECLTNKVYERCDFKYVRFNVDCGVEVEFNKCTFEGVDFYGCTFVNIKFKNCKFVDCYFEKNSFHNGSIELCDFDKCGFYENGYTMKMGESVMASCMFNKEMIVGLAMENCNIRECRLEKCLGLENVEKDEECTFYEVKKI